jgi:heme A synthase
LFVGLLSLIIYLFRATPRVRRLAAMLGGLFIVQLFAGMVNLVLLAPVWMQVVHLLLADLVWVALVLLAAANFGESELRQNLLEPVKSPEAQPASQNRAANFSQRAPKP